MSTKLPQIKVFHWHTFVPLYAVVLVLVMTATYFLALNFPASTDSAVRPVPSSLTSQFNGLLLTMLAAGIVILSFIVIGVLFKRLEKIRTTVEALSAGHHVARTLMEPHDEVGRLGKALDGYADYIQARHDNLREHLHRERRANERLNAVLEALPEGVIVQDLTGRVVTMNARASEMLGVRPLLKSAPEDYELTAIVRDQLGLPVEDSDLSESQQLVVKDRILNRWVTSITTAGEPIGSVLILRDVTEDAAQPTSVKKVTDEIRQHTSALQTMIREMRELTDPALRKIPEQGQQPISVDTLVWAVANEWRQVAQAQNLEFHVVVEKPGLCILGQERRLRRAIGNVIDNAIKYTPPGGGVSLEVHGDEIGKHAHIWVRDNGVGIAPMTRDGRDLQVAGSGQGLTLARQIIQAHGGTLTVKSKQGVGTGVYLQLPLTAPIDLALPPLLSDLDGETVQVVLVSQLN